MVESNIVRYQGIKVTLVTGFLGAGKTTLIRQLLEQAPLNERWAVLVNEFGDIGLDSVFYSNSGVAVKEVPGGCVCCTTSAAFQQGLNQLIKQHNPDRIFIEPSGLGHPKQILQQLRSPAYHDVLLVTGAFCVIDGRTLNDTRYTQHDIYNDQIESANGIVFSHVDQYQADDFAMIETRFGSVASPLHNKSLFLSHPMVLQQEQLDIGLLPRTFMSVSAVSSVAQVSHQQDSVEPSQIKSTEQNPDGSWFYQKEQDAMQVLGWRWPEGKRFREENILSLIDVISALEGVYRIKGVYSINESEAVFVNASRGKVTVETAHWEETSRMEIIGNITGVWAQKSKRKVDAI